MTEDSVSQPVDSIGPSARFSLAGSRVAFVGKLGGINRREAKKLVRDHGGTPVADSDPEVDLLVIGADELPVDSDSHLDDEKLRLGAEGRLEIIGETELWQRLGLLELETHVRRLYTPAMLAELLGVSVAHVRRWHRRGLIVAAREVNRLPYFDFQEISVAQQLAQLVAAGESVKSIENKLAQLSQFLPDVERPLAQLSVLIEGREILMRQGEGLIEPGGQLRIDFDSFESSENSEPQVTVSFETLDRQLDPNATLQDYISFAADCEDDGRMQQAVEIYRSALIAYGPNAEICFRMAELFSLTGELNAARERYFMAIELDEAYIEARANLGCLLMDLDQVDLAIAAFEGTLEYHADYPDVHFHLARIYDDRFQTDKAEEHWQQFLELAPHSPWAEEARSRLGITQ